MVDTTASFLHDKKEYCCTQRATVPLIDLANFENTIRIVAIDLRRVRDLARQQEDVSLLNPDCSALKRPLKFA
jgi:hypothetical protein